MVWCLEIWKTTVQRIGLGNSTLEEKLALTEDTGEEEDRRVHGLNRGTVGVKCSQAQKNRPQRSRVLLKENHFPEAVPRVEVR